MASSAAMNGRSYVPTTYNRTTFLLVNSFSYQSYNISPDMKDIVVRILDVAL